MPRYQPEKFSPVQGRMVVTIATIIRLALLSRECSADSEMRMCVQMIHRKLLPEETGREQGRQDGQVEEANANSDEGLLGA